jgi:hypothetical protein
MEGENCKRDSIQLLLTFHKHELQGAGIDVSKTHSMGYKALDLTKLKPYQKIQVLIIARDINLTF